MAEKRSSSTSRSPYHSRQTSVSGKTGLIKRRVLSNQPIGVELPNLTTTASTIVVPDEGKRSTMIDPGIKCSNYSVRE